MSLFFSGSSFCSGSYSAFCPLFIHLEELCILVSYDFDIFEEDSSLFCRLPSAWICRCLFRIDVGCVFGREYSLAVLWPSWGHRLTEVCGKGVSHFLSLRDFPLPCVLECFACSYENCEVFLFFIVKIYNLPEIDYIDWFLTYWEFQANVWVDWYSVPSVPSFSFNSYWLV